MGKEKKQSAEGNKKESIFYYELLGLIQIIISIVSLIKLGIVGLYLALLFKLLFGEWYFIIILLLFFNGIRMIISHETFNYKNLRFIGIVFLILSLLTFSHFTFHEFIDSYEMNNFQLTFSFYIDAFKNKEINNLSGGGIIGSLIFYMFYSLFGKFGAILIAVVLIYSGISFMFQKTVYEFTTFFIFKFKSILNKLFKLKKILKYEIKQHNFVRKINITEIKEEPVINNEEEYSSLLYTEIKKYLSSLNLFYGSINKIISNHLIIIHIVFYTKVDVKNIYHYFKSNFPFPFLLRYDTSNKETNIYFEFTKKVPCSYSYSNSLNNSSTDEIVLGVSPFNKELKYKLNDNLLIISDIKNDYFLSLSLLIQSKCSKKKDIYFISSDYYYGNLFIHKDHSFLEELYHLTEERIILFNNYGCSSFNEYQKKYNSKIRELVILFDNFDEILNNELYNLYLYNIISVSKNAGVYLVGNITNDCMMDNITLQAFPSKICLKNNFKITNNLIEKNLIEQMSKIEGVFLYRNEITRIGLSLILNNDLKNLLKKLNK